MYFEQKRQYFTQKVSEKQKVMEYKMFVVSQSSETLPKGHLMYLEADCEAITKLRDTEEL